jgi:hypothetical protein
VRDGGAPGAAKEDDTRGEEDTEGDEDEEEDRDEDEDERQFCQLLAHDSFAKYLQLNKPRLSWIFQLYFASVKSSSISRSLLLSISPCFHLSKECSC